MRFRPRRRSTSISRPSISGTTSPATISASVSSDMLHTHSGGSSSSDELHFLCTISGLLIGAGSSNEWYWPTRRSTQVIARATIRTIGFAFEHIPAVCAHRADRSRPQPTQLLRTRRFPSRSGRHAGGRSIHRVAAESARCSFGNGLIHPAQPAVRVTVSDGIDNCCRRSQAVSAPITLNTLIAEHAQTWSPATKVTVSLRPVRRSANPGARASASLRPTWHWTSANAANSTDGTWRSASIPAAA